MTTPNTNRFRAPAAVAALWGFAEATLFFIVPDVLLSFVALDSRRRALVACGFAVLGALPGGALMYAWGRAEPAAARAAVARVPAISVAMLDDVLGDLERDGAAALVAGALTGRPYKAYAVLAPRAGIGLPAFLAVSVPGRLLRFVLVVLLVHFVARRLPAGWSPPRRRLLLAAIWTVFYAAFFALMPN